MEATTITIPWPPSVNHYWRAGRGKGKNALFLTDRALAYRKEVAWCAHRAPDYGDARLKLVIEAYPPDRRKRDLDNLFKATLDALGHAAVYTDDGQIDELTIARRHVVPGGRMEVSVEVAT